MDPPRMVVREKAFCATVNVHLHSSAQQWRRKVSHLRNLVSRSLRSSRSLDTRFLRWLEKRAHCLCEKNNVLFFRSRRVKSHGKTPAIQQRESLFWSCLLSLVAILHAVRLPIDRQDFCVM